MARSEFLVGALLCISGLTVSCGQQKQSTPPGTFIINGTISGAAKGRIYLSYSDSSAFVVDSTEPKEGKFYIKGKASQPGAAYLWVGMQERGKFLTFFLSDTVMNIELNKDSLPASRVSSTPQEDDYKEYLRMKNPIMSKLHELEKTANALSDNGKSEEDNKAIYDSLTVQYIALRDKDRTIMMDFVKDHPNSIVSAWAVATSNLVYNPDVDRLKVVYSELGAGVKKTSYAAQIKKILDMSEMLAVGKPAPDFTANDTLGKPVALSSFKGKYLLLDFWASWCHPCRGENPNVVEAYKKFKDKNFTVLQVSLDDSKEAWVKAIHEDKLPWSHVSDLKGWSSAIAVQYGVQSIPSNFLLDPSGKIIAHDLRGSDLDETLGNVLK